MNASYAADGYARIRGAAMLATTYGVGELIRHALTSPLSGGEGPGERSIRHLVIGLGGSATNDGGAGALQALGVDFFDALPRNAMGKLLKQHIRAQVLELSIAEATS